jgi:hypothetical protein
MEHFIAGIDNLVNTGRFALTRAKSREAVVDFRYIPPPAGYTLSVICHEQRPQRLATRADRNMRILAVREMIRAALAHD